MNSYVVDCLKRYRQVGVLIDTNAALLYIIGSINIGLIGKDKRTSMYSVGDFELLERFVESFPKRYTTPSVLTELSNLLSPSVHPGLASYIVNSIEVYEPSATLLHSTVFQVLGLADASIHDLVQSKLKVLVVTEDGPLAAALRSNSIDVLTMREILDK